MKYYIIAGEASGDLHASNLVKQLKLKDPQASFRVWGGDLLEKEGAVLVRHYRDLAFMGFIEVIANLRTILKNIEFCKNDIKSFQPDCIILVDYPGFNLRIAAFAASLNIKVVYYISPQVWAWKQSRVKQIKQNVDLMLVILPFEKEFYKRFNYEVEFVGHPLIDAIASEEKYGMSDSNIDIDDKPVIALLPGSRKQEISVMLPIMLSIVDQFPEYNFQVGEAPSVDKEFYANIIGKADAQLYSKGTYSLLKKASAALVTSGTATLETALFNVPEIVCYKGNSLSYYIARKLIKVKYISLVNLIMDEEVVKELIQDELNKKNLVTHLKSILEKGEKRNKLMESYSKLKEILGGEGASERAADLIGDMMGIGK